MSRRFWHVFTAAILLLSLLVGGSANSPSALADPPVSTISWPSIPMPGATLFAHGDGSLTVASSDCSYFYNYGDSTISTVTYSPGQVSLYSLSKNTSGWKLPACDNQIEVGSDGTTYLVQQNATSGAQRIIARRGDATLWVKTLPNGNCANSVPKVFNPTLGYDGNLYFEVSYSGWSPCLGSAKLLGVHSATGESTGFNVTLPAADIASNNYFTGNDILPYDSGVAVVNNRLNVYFYTYGGAQETSKTFSPTGFNNSPYGDQPKALSAAITSTGRVFLNAYGYVGTTPTQKVLYKDVSSSTVNEASVSSSRNITTTMYATPGGGFAILLSSSGPTYYLDYYNSSGTQVYEVNLSNETGAYMASGAPKLAVDNLGNVLVVRRMVQATGSYDYVINVDSFNASGTKTRLFDSGTQFGTSGTDYFTTSNWIPASLGDGELYLTLCRSGSFTNACNTAGNPQIVVIPMSGSFSYPRSEVFDIESGRRNYVALGDSYSAGEGNPPFIAPTDNNGGNGCDRSAADAYPVLLAADTSLNLSLRAFVACSGATSAELIAGKNGEPGQLTALNEDTDVVTITAGGNDSGFPDFAAECVFPGCDTTTPQYISTMSYIDNYLQGGLEQLYEAVRDAAPNAQIFVVGYPRIAPPYNTFCEVASTNDGIDAVNNVANNLNDKIEAAVDNSGDDITFVDPTATGSPFLGHELCVTDADSYFYSYNNFEHRFSFHPNADGQAAYKELIASYM